MKKLLVFSLAVLLLSCTSEDVGITELSGNHPGDGSHNPDKSASDAFLIDAIQGNNPDYEDLSDLLDLLLDNVALSADVLTVLVEEPRLDDPFVEMVLVASSPFSSEGIDIAMNIRPTLNREVLESAQDISPGSTFTMIGYPEMKAVFSENLYRTPVITAECPDGCSSLLHSEEGEYLNVINLTPVDEMPEYMGGCNPNKWICGEPEIISYEVNNGHSITVTLNCNPAERKCIRILRTAMGTTPSW